MKILLISSEYTGHGHQSICAALTEQFARYDGVQTETVDGFTWIGRMGIYMSKSYGPTTRYVKSLHRLTYQLGNRSAENVAELIAAMIRKKFTEYIRVNRPDLIVTSHPLFNGSICILLKEMGEDIPVIAHQADLINIHTTWCDPRAFRTICLTPEAEEVTLRQGLPRDKVLLGGFPTRQAFCDAARAGQKKPYDGTGPFHCLIASGGEGSGSLRKYAKRLLRGFDCRVTVLCGRNHRLKNLLEEDLSEYGGRLAALGFVDNVQDYLMDADLMIARASPNTLMEAVVCATPLIISGALPGQEEENPGMFASHGLGVYCPNAKDLDGVVRGLMADGAKGLNEIRQAQLRYRNLDNAKNNVEMIMKLYKQYMAGQR